MAKKLKDYYDVELAKELAGKIRRILPDFSEKEFINFFKGKLDELEFHDRQDVFVSAFDQFLPKGYVKRLGIFKKMLGEKLTQDTGMFTFGYFLWPVGRFVQTFGTENVSKSLDFIYELTQRFTGEFAIRPILEKDPNLVLETLQNWSKDKSVHVRRLSSEAIRTRLPWANKNTIFIDHFEKCFLILDNLKNAPEKFVQKSVANNINDLFKDRPDLAEEIITRFEKTKNLTPQTVWIIKHATRSKRKIRGQTSVKSI